MILRTAVAINIAVMDTVKINRYMRIVIVMYVCVICVISSIVKL